MAPPTTPQPTVETVVDATQTLFDKMISVLTDFKDALGSVSDVAEQMNEGFTANLRLQMIRDYGGEITKVTKEEFAKGDFSKILNEGERAVVKSLRDMDSYMKDLQIYEGLDPKQIEENRQNLLKQFGDFNINLLKKNNAEIEKQSMLFSKSMNISLDETAKLVQLNFARTGEASTKILTEITNNAKAVGDAAGVPLKVMADGIAEVMTDMETFTDITVQSAARMTAKLSQLGLSLGSFKQVLEPFRDFDSAATKIGDLSAMFGVQMDAMEMMYLSNENEEEFLNRFREQILDQGIDVETMSKTRQRALAEQLGMNVETMKMFLNSQMSYTEASELMAATGEAAEKTQVDAQTQIEKGLVLAVRNSKDLTDATVATQAVLRTFDVSNFTQQIGKMQKELMAVASDENAVKKILQQMNDLSAGAAGQLAGFGVASAEFVRKSIPQVDPAQLSAAKDAGKAGPAAYAEGVKEGALEIEAAIEPMSANSWPKILQEMANGFGSDKDGKPNAQMDFYVKTINQWSDTLSKAASEGVLKIIKSFDLTKLSTSFEASSKSVADNIEKAVAQVETNPSVNPTITLTAPSATNQFSQMFKNLEDAVQVATKEIANLNQTLLNNLDTTPEPGVTNVNPVTPVTPAVAAANTTSIVASPEPMSGTEEKSAVKFDTENLKKEIIEAIKEGFASGNYGFELFLDGKSVATSLQLIRDSSNRKIQFVGS